MAAAKGGKSGRNKNEERVGEMGECGDGGKEEKGKCGGCGLAVTETGLGCEICDKWFHIKCQGITQTKYDAINEVTKYVHWYCKGCDQGAVNMLRKIRERQDELAEDVMKIKEEMKGLKGGFEKIGKVEAAQEKDRERVRELEVKVGAIEKMGQDRKKEAIEVKELQQSFAKIVTEQEEERKKEVKVDDKQIQEKMIEMMERDKRKNNLILIGVSEYERGEEEQKRVEEIVEALITEANVKFEIMGRVGRKDPRPGTTAGRVRPRPIRIVVEDTGDRRRLLARGKTLKGKAGFEEIFVVPDLTKLQQEEDKKLRDKLKEIRESGKKQARIEKGEIVEEVEGKKEVLFSSKK